ncbi:hypothetical protein DUI87_11378 [Hirundo rustica rustica]|uniref:RNA helicase n=1 Tax=Hirundo rustica rustica TaxID=333673 RepID=A0A3M0KJS0_HIRRU|nr:hypothetical protein DUI87_11378 [Hirundo rustica rustica]
MSSLPLGTARDPGAATALCSTLGHCFAFLRGLLARGFTETHYLRDGTDVVLTRNHTGHCYYHGQVQGYPESSVSLSSCSGLRGIIVFENHSYILEPLEGAASEHKIYRAEKLRAAPGSCGHQLDFPATGAAASATSQRSPAARYKRETLKTTKYVELVIVADNREFYRPLNIRVALVGVEVWNDMDKCSISQDPFTSLHEFLDWRKLKLLPRKAHDNAQLISGVYFQGTTIGMAPIMSMCTAEQSGGVVMDHSENPLGAAVTLAHELGHNFGMNHDTLERGCSCKASTDRGGCIMNPSTGGVFESPVETEGDEEGVLHVQTRTGRIKLGLGREVGLCTQTPTCFAPVLQFASTSGELEQRFWELCENPGAGRPPDGKRAWKSPPLTLSWEPASTSYPFPMVFSSCSRKDLENSLEKGVGMCLFNLPEVKESFGGQKCGNGYVEDGEECDCGEPELKAAGISCRESSNSCDLPEFCTGAGPQCPANVYLHDGHACHGVDGYCYNGICQTHEQQCITLWGPGAKPAPGICFERVNSAGDPYGNCGKDSKSSFAKCEPRDAKCGKIQCQGGANRPVIGTNAVSIETNIPLQEGGKILCRGTHVYLGDDMPDPGLVLAGTKCEDGKICLNRRCQNTSVFGVHKCATKCHGRGVCNNKKNCHCEADWAPPFCDRPGFGGSVDSGPVRQADNKSLTVGVLITILCLIFAGSIMYLKRKTFMRWLFTSKKTTIEKLRSVSPARPSSSSEPNHVHTTCASKNLIMKPQNTTIPKREGPRRPLPYQIIDISSPVKTHQVPPLKTPQRVLPPLPQLPGHQAGPERPLPANPALRFSQVFQKQQHFKLTPTTFGDHLEFCNIIDIFDRTCSQTSTTENHCISESLDGSDGDEEEILVCGEDLELNPFDGLPYSSRYYRLMKEREELPIWKEKCTFMESLLHNQIVIVSGDAKTGKSSQVPQWCAEHCLALRPRGAVVCTQVLRQAAVALALRVADQMDVNLGHEVGYSVPFESCCTPETILRYCTDEVLQREMMSTPLLNCYSVIVLDDVHERTVATDALLGLLRAVLAARAELRLVLLTAPHACSTLQRFCGGVPVIRARGTHRAQAVFSCSAHREPFLSALRLLLEIHHAREKGDIVIFLACEQEIEKAYQMIRQEQSNLNPDLGELIPIPLYPTKQDLTPKLTQDKQKHGKKYRRKVLLTTSSGESLIWTKNLTFVIDVGVETRKVYNPRIRADSVLTQPISQSQAEVHKQILGMSPSGKIFCLYPEEFTHREMKAEIPAKVQESNLTSLVLFLKRMDIAGFSHCDFISSPAPESLMQALEDLDYLAALDNDGNLSEFGIIMSEFPLDPQLSKSLLASCEFECVDEMLTIAAMVTDFSSENWCRDNFLSCSALSMAEVIRAELVEIMKRIELPISRADFGSEENLLSIKKALLSGYFMHIARDVDGSGNYLMLTHKQVAQLHPFSSYYNTRRIPEWVLFHEFSISEGNSIRVVSEISPHLFAELVPQYYFSNLPPSESKDILQEVINHLAPVSATKEEQKTANDSKENEEFPQTPTEQRCVIQ